MKNEKYKFIKPIASLTNRREYNEFILSDPLKKITDLENSFISSSTDPFIIKGFCIPCDKKVSFIVDMEFGGRVVGDNWVPNWRERIECPFCKMNNRQRLMSALIKQELDTSNKKNVYFMEQVTPIYNWAVSTFNEHSIVGSEYLGYEYIGGDIIKGIRHEDIEDLSFADNALDLIISNDVFEHVPHPEKAFSECSRSLKPGGVMLATIPFGVNADKSTTRARLVGENLEHIQDPVYHGNPLSDDGSLVFTDYGWDLLQLMESAGFFKVELNIYSSEELGHLGGGQIVFKGIKKL